MMDPQSLIWIRESPRLTKSSPRPRSHARRSHKKSRRGCQTCKERRVKCDEVKPSCGQCRYRHTQCDYSPCPGGIRKKTPSPPASVDQHNELSTPTPDLGAEACLGIHVLAASISQSVHDSAMAGSTNNSFHHILHHFQNSAYLTLSSPIGQEIIRDITPRMIYNYPFLLHTIIAFSASHLAYLAIRHKQRQSLFVTSTYHAQRALSCYSARLKIYQETPEANGTEQTVHEMDALLAACLILTSLFYNISEVDVSNTPDATWTISTSNPANSTSTSSSPANSCHGSSLQEPSSNWITTSSGITILLGLASFKSNISKCRMLPCLLDIANASSHQRKPQPSKQDIQKTQFQLQHRDHGIEKVQPSSTYTAEMTPPYDNIRIDLNQSPNIPPALLRYCLAANRTVSNPYISTLAELSPLFPPISTSTTVSSSSIPSRPSPSIPPPSTNFGLLISVPSRLSPEFKSLLASHDTRALLLMGHWWAMLSLRAPRSHWWCLRRARTESQAVLGFLERGVGDGSSANGRVESELRYQAGVGRGGEDRLREECIAELRKAIERSL